MSSGISITKAFTAILLCCAFYTFTACINQIDKELETEIIEGKIPISFSVKIDKINTKVTNSTFDSEDKMGLLATTNSNTLKDRRYIDNMLLRFTENGTVVPESPVFYPEGDVALNFISYYPYQESGVASGSSIIPVSVLPDQSNESNRSSSDFLVAKNSNVTSKTATVALEYQHKFAKLNIVITPPTGISAENLVESNPRITAAGFYTAADYDLEKESFSNLSKERTIVASGEWVKKSGKAVGKELIIIPQEINGDESKSIIMEWNGRIYSCPIKSADLNKSNIQCEIDIQASITESNILEGFISEIEEWGELSYISTENETENNAIYLTSLAFSKSNIYHIYHEGIAVGEICREYLKSESLTSRAIVYYPINGKKSDLKNGIVLQLIDSESSICGGKISWADDGKEFSYQQSTLEDVEKFYLDANYNVCFDKPENAIKLNVIANALVDIRAGKTYNYPITKIGTQYWMAEQLRATEYTDNTSITKQTMLGQEAGYFKPDGFQIYFYNGEALLTKKLAPKGWKIPADKDWEQLSDYLDNDLSVLKDGTWEVCISGDLKPVNCLTDFYAYPLGTWSDGEWSHAYKMTAFWAWDYENNTVSSKAYYLIGEKNEFEISTAKTSTTPAHYKALTVRCIKE